MINPIWTPQFPVTQNDQSHLDIITDNNYITDNAGGIWNEGQPQGIAPTVKTLGDIIGAFESITTVEYIRGIKNKKWKPFDGKLWQRNYWEHIIRDEKSYQTISNYIVNNPSKWNDDSLNSG